MQKNEQASTSLNSPTPKFHNNETEEAVLTGLIQKQNERHELLSELSEEDFFDEKNKNIFNAIFELSQNEDRIDLLSIQNKTGVKFSELSNLVDKYFDIYSIKSHVEALKGYSDLRFLVSSLSSANRADSSEARKKLIELSTSIIKRVRDNEKEKTKISDIVHEINEEQQLNAKAVKENGLIGMSSGYQAIDNAISGLRAPLYYVIKADTSVGKSALLLSMVSTVLNQGKRVLLFSLEMSKFQNVSRLIGMRAGLDPLEIEKGAYMNTEEELEEKAKLFEQDLVIYEHKRSASEIVMAAHAENSAKKVDLVAIDYLQNISIPETRYEAYTQASNEIQKMCKDLNVPVLLASQVNTEGQTRGSGDVKNHANFVIHLKKSDELGAVAGERIMDIEKNRHGMVEYGVKLQFKPGGKIVEI